MKSSSCPGLVGRGVTHGLNMQLARHTFAAELRRMAGIDAASQTLGHADLNTTLGINGHRDQTDLEPAMEGYARWLEQQREDGIAPPERDPDLAQLSRKVGGTRHCANHVLVPAEAISVR